MDKQKIISDIYYDKSGYGSKGITLKDARQKDKLLLRTMLISSLKRMLRKKGKCEGRIVLLLLMPLGISTGFVSISKNDFKNQKFRIGLILTDIFSKYATVIPIASKQPPDV